MIGYKLFRKRKDGTLGPLFINRKQRLEIGKSYQYEAHPTKGFAVRPGWHCCSEPVAPHLSKKDRVWCKVEVKVMKIIQRTKAQGSIWYLCEAMTIVEELAI